MHELRARALVWTDDLARSSGESVYLGVLHQQGVLIVHHVFRPDDSRQVLEVGAMQPLHSTALGKVLSAYDPVAHSEVLEAERKAFTAAHDHASWTSFEGVLDLTRARGYAADVEETWEGVASVAAPIHDRRRMPVGRGGHHRRRGAGLRGRGAAARADRGGTGLRPRGVAGPGRRAVLSRPPRSRGPSDAPALSRTGAGRDAKASRPRACAPVEIDSSQRSITIVLSITELLTCW